MMLTEEEARKQVCPFIRYCTNEVGVVAERESAIHYHQSCQGSDCKIGWRWASERDEATGNLGYCGACGRPM
ncbi:hypothetical protein [Bradyrhizobium sp. 174]|uniref:hypothetical protein n=1 Tax=Bradyrhizobium sp. 174 TaxID=2782645 RepID=UPI001FF7CFB8|nr:hypothetical protein [Bradyrhizobium sp. 174]MCK1577882.1 hypothetical protein [Bradyrhizobium sp. 174]